jgi:molybdate transport system substrate-binding protein
MRGRARVSSARWKGPGRAIERESTAYEEGLVRDQAFCRADLKRNGILDPLRTLELVVSLRDAVPGLDLELHAHNDLGMAVANTVTALAAGAWCVVRGARCASVTVNGLGERAGNAALEEVVMALKVALRVDAGVVTRDLCVLSRAAPARSASRKCAAPRNSKRFRGADDARDGSRGRMRLVPATGVLHSHAMNPRRFLLAVLGAFGLLGCHPATPPSTSPPVELRVAAAADLKFALEEVAAAFTKKNGGVKVSATYGSSGVLSAQIENGAAFDLFLSADVKFARRLIEVKAADGATLFSYAVGHLVIWAPQSFPLDVEKLGAQALLTPEARKVAIANPAVAPYGKAAVAALKSLGVYEAVQPKLVLGENIAQTAQFVESGAADVGILALSLAVASPMKDKGRYWPVPLDAYPPLEQAGVIPAKSAHPAEARALTAFLESPVGREILNRYGFQLPP